MKLLKLNLVNFQGIKNFSLKTNGLDVSIYGDNGTGKTTLFNAFTWLLYGKASTGEKNYTPQTTGSHHLDHSAEMTLEIGNGAVTQINLKKVYHEVYKTQRGSADAVFSGFTTDYYIDGVPVKEKEYNARLTEIYESEERAKQLTRPFYFLEEMSVKERRKLLLNVCGNIDDKDVISQHEDLSGLESVLNGRDIESYLKIAAAQKKEIDKELKAIPQRIDEAEKAMPQVSGDRDAINSQILDFQQKKAELESRLSALDAMAETEVLRQISLLELEKIEAGKKYLSQHENESREEQKKVIELCDHKSDLERKIRLKKEAVRDREDAVSRHKEKRENLLLEYREVYAREWKGDTNCPTCGQPLPEDQIEKAKKAFNVKKADELEKISSEGQKYNAAIIEAEEKEISEIKAVIEQAENELNNLEEQIEDARSMVKRAEAPKFENTAAANKYDSQIWKLQDRLKEIQNGSNSEKEDLNNQIREISKKVAALQEELSAFFMIDKQNDRIHELEASEKKLAAEYEKLEHGMYLCELFNRRKAKMLTSKINSRFKTLKFRLFIEQINGGIADDCEAIIPCEAGEVPFKSANNAARINAGLEVIDTLGEYYGLSMPIYIDNAESNTHISTTKAQQIRLYVSENDKELRVKEA